MSKIDSLFNRVVEVKMSGPKVYFPSMTPAEVLSYASQYAETELEKILAERLGETMAVVDALENESSLAFELHDAGEDLVASIKLDGGVGDSGWDAVDDYESRVNAAYVKYQKG